MDYSLTVTRALGFAGYGPREDIVGPYMGGSTAFVGGLVQFVFGFFGPLIMALAIGFVCLQLFDIEFGQFSNNYIRIFFGLSFFLHAVLLISALAGGKILAIPVIVISQIVTLIQIMAALSLLQIWTGYEDIDGTLLFKYREWVLTALASLPFDLEGWTGAAVQTVEQNGKVAAEQAYKFGYDVAVYIVGALVMGIFGFGGRRGTA